MTPEKTHLPRLHPQGDIALSVGLSRSGIAPTAQPRDVVP
jgi:hypothetical protein